MLTATSSQPINTTSTTTNMELQPLKDALKEMQQQEELQMLKSLGSTLQATTDYRSEILQNLTKTVKDLRMKKEQVETGVQATRNLLAETQYETRRSQYLQRRRELDSQITQLRHSIETKERKLDGLVNEEREVVKEGECKAGARNVDKNALKLKIYRMLGFELQLNSSIGSGNDGSAIDDKFEFLRVRSGANDDVVKFGMDQFLNGGSSVDLTNRLWNICSKDSVQPSSSC